MRSTFYIASSRERLEDVRLVAVTLESIGMTNSFAWHDHFDHRCTQDRCGIKNRQHLARLELRAAGQCDLFIGIARLGKGSHVELGAALTGYVERIILVGCDPADSVFYDAGGVEHVTGIPGLMALLNLVKR